MDRKNKKIQPKKERLAKGKEEAKKSCRKVNKATRRYCANPKMSCDTSSWCKETDTSEEELLGSLTGNKNNLKGWTEHKDKKGRSYYYNSITGKSVWTLPEGAQVTSMLIDKPKEEKINNKNIKFTQKRCGKYNDKDGFMKGKKKERRSKYKNCSSASEKCMIKAGTLKKP